MKTSPLAPSPLPQEQPASPLVSPLKMTRLQRTRRAVAQYYFQDSSPRQAVERLNRCIKSDPFLRRLLHRAGYRPRKQRFTPAILRVLEEYL